MSEVAAHPTPAVDPAAIDPTTMATDATSDPIRPTGTDALLAESRPEVTTAGDEIETPSAAGTTVAAASEITAETATSAQASPITEGVLGYKGPGLIKSFRFSKKFFWFGNEAVDQKHLDSYLTNEKPEVAHHNASHAMHTGKGLLLFAKRSEDKAQPAGILNMSDASDFTREDMKDFSFKIHSHKHTFQASSKAERDSWFSALETTAAEAKSSRESVVGSDAYKNHMSKLKGPVAAAAAIPAGGTPKSVATPTKTTDDKVHDGTLSSNNLVAAEAHPTSSDKSRSQSRKRQSIFGKVLGKKDELEEKREIKKEEKAEAKEVKGEEKAEKAELGGEKKEVKHDNTIMGGAGTFDAAAVAARVVGEPVTNTEGTAVGESALASATDSTATTAAVSSDAAPKPTKRGSVFGSLFGKKEGASPVTERKEKDVVPAVPAKDTEVAPIGTAALQLETTAPVSPTGQDAPVESEPAAAAPAVASPTVASPASKTTSPTESKGGIFGFMKQKEMQRDEKKEEKKETNTEEIAEKDGEAPAVATEVPVASGPVSPSPLASDSVSPVNSSEPVKDKRRQSFFSSLGGKKEKRTDATSGDESSGNKLGGLFRKASRSTKGSMGPVADSSAPPAPISKDVSATTESASEATETAVPNGVEAPAASQISHEPALTEHAPTSQSATVMASA